MAERPEYFWTSQPELIIEEVGGTAAVSDVEEGGGTAEEFFDEEGVGGNVFGDDNIISGGYDCQFVSPPSDVFQTNCPVCLQILKEPCVISCPCGQKICRECVEQIKENDGPCPMCNKSDFTFLRDYGFERSLKELEVWCSHKKDGCEWRGKLGEFDEHLNENPSDENRLVGCPFIELECKHKCGKRIQRCNMATHQDQECPERPYSCEYCHDYDSTYEDTTRSHYPDCECFPVTCPNECRDDPFQRQELNGHLDDECPLMEVKCPLHYAGCEVRLPRKDMPKHTQDTVTHFTLLASFTQKQHEELVEKYEASQAKVKMLEGELNQLKLSLAQKSGFPIDFRVDYYEGDEQYLPPFYTHSHGYRMCIRVNTNCRGRGKTHVSLFTHLMKGEYDDHLKWPFRGEITIQIVNQAGDHDHFEKTITYSSRTSDSSADRVLWKERAEGRGKKSFISHKDLRCSDFEVHYLKNNIIIVRVLSVKLTIE